MSTSDKISWVGGMMGLFTGFSVISGIEIIYWLWFKVLLHKNSVEPEQERQESEECRQLREEMKEMRNDIQELRINVKQSQDPKAGLYFDAIFNDVEAQKADEETRTNSVTSMTSLSTKSSTE